jgi:hypothetical protein
MHPLERRRCPCAVRNFWPRQVNPQGWLKRRILRRGQPVRFLVPAGRFGLHINIEQTIRVESERVAAAEAGLRPVRTDRQVMSRPRILGRL